MSEDRRLKSFPGTNDETEKEALVYLTDQGDILEQSGN